MLSRAVQKLAISPAGINAAGRVLMGAGACKVTELTGIHTAAANAVAQAEVSPKNPYSADEQFDEGTIRLDRPVDLEFEMDKDDPEFISVEELHSPKVRAAIEDVLGRPVDLETAMDRDDTECLGPEDIEELQNPKVRSAVLEALGRPVELDDEFDLLHEPEEGGDPRGTVSDSANTSAERGPKYDDTA